VVPITFVYYLFSNSLIGALLAAVIMMITGFLFSGVGGWLVGLVGGSNQPIPGLALSTLIVAALVMVGIGVVGLSGVAAVLAVAAVVCCATAMAGDMIQDLKVGHLIGGTPWKMEVAEVISTVIVSFVLVFPIINFSRRQHRSQRNRNWRHRASCAASRTDGATRHRNCWR